MALVEPLVRLLARQKERYRFSGRLLTLGILDVLCEGRDIRDIPIFSHLPQSTVTYDQILKALGFDAIDTLEYYGCPEATIEHDLNLPISQKWSYKYDFILDAGHLEHVFSTGDFMRTVATVLKPGGVALHFNPTQGYANHGFFCLQPTFYYSFYRANGFTNMDCYFLEFNSNYRGPTRVIPIPNFNNLDYKTQNCAYMFFKAEKGHLSDIKIPNIEFYHRIWEEKQKRNGAKLPEALYLEIVGRVPDNSMARLLKNSFDIGIDD